MYPEQFVEEPWVVSNGMAEIPDRPGIGVTVNWDVVEKYRIEPKDKPYPYPGLLLRVDWPSGSKSYFTHAQQMWDAFGSGDLPAFTPGVNLVRVEDNGDQQGPARLMPNRPETADTCFDTVRQPATRERLTVTHRALRRRWPPSSDRSRIARVRAGQSQLMHRHHNGKRIPRAVSRPRTQPCVWTRLESREVSAVLGDDARDLQNEFFRNKREFLNQWLEGEVRN